MLSAEHVCSVHALKAPLADLRSSLKQTRLQKLGFEVHETNTFSITSFVDFQIVSAYYVVRRKQ